MPDSGVRHLHKRKRLEKKFPHPNPKKRFLDRVVFVTCFVTPMMIIPQAWKIWSQKDASGISLITYVGLVITNIIWIIYGTAHKEKPIIILYSFLLLVNAVIAVGRIVYG